MKIGIVGLGDVGLPLAIAFCEAGHEVVGVDTDPRVADALAAGHSHVPYFCVERIARALNDHSKSVRGSRIGIFGVSYKPGVGDLRESPALRIIGLLRDQGAEIVYHDDFVPELPEHGLRSDSPEDVDCTVIVTAHPGLDLERLVRESPLVVDFRGVTRGIEASNLVRL